MGLFEKASQLSGERPGEAPTPGVDAPAASGGIAGAVHGLRARAEAFRRRSGAAPATGLAAAASPELAGVAPAREARSVAAEAPPAARPFTPDPDAAVVERAPGVEAPESGVRIRGLLRRAESLREAGPESAPEMIPPLPESAARGLLARARSFRETEREPRPAPASSAGPVRSAPPTTREPAEAATSPATTDFAPAESDPGFGSREPGAALPESDPYEVEELAPEYAEPGPGAGDVLESPAALDTPVDGDALSEGLAPAASPAFAEDEDLVLSAPEPGPPSDTVADDRDGLVDEATPRADETPIMPREAEVAAAEEPVATDDQAPSDDLSAVPPPEARELEDPLFDDLIPDSYVGRDDAATDARDPAQAPTGEAEPGASPEAAAGDELPAFDPGPTPVDAGLRDFDEFLERELLPEDLPAEAQAPVPGDADPSGPKTGASDAGAAGWETAVDDRPPAMFADEDYDALIDPDSDLSDAAREGELPRWPYEPPGPDADPARDRAARMPGEDEDPFGLWELDAEKEAEQQARQLEIKGDSHASDRGGDEGMLFEVDEGFTTAPVEAHIASQKKIDHYLSLFDITKEISNISEFDELWENILYAIMGQVGAETICIMSSTSRVSSGAIFYPVSHSGFELPDGWALGRGDEIYDQMANSTGVRYAEEFLTSLQNPISPLERRILENTRAKLVVPLKNMNQMFGIVILGGQVSGDDYTIDDIEFLTLLGEIAAVGVDRVLSRIEFERDTEELRRRNMVHGSMFSLARRASGVKSLDDVYDILTRHLREDFYAESFSVVLLSPRDRRYRIFAGNEISPESIEKFSLDVNSELIATISNLVRVYDLKDFRENRELTGCYTNDDLGLMQHYWLVPLINMNWLVGFITIHRTRIPWTEFHRELMVTAAEIVSSVFANCIIMNERESLFRDPFSPLEERLKQELQKSARFAAPVSLVDIRVKNIRRILEINPAEEVTGFLMSLNRSIASSLFETDFMARVGQGRFALILPGRGRVEAEIFVKKLKADFNRMRLLPGSPIDVQYAHQIISAPDDADEAGKMLSIFE